MLSPHLSSILVATVFWEVEEFLAFCRGKGKFSKFAIVHISGQKGNIIGEGSKNLGIVFDH